MKSSSSLEKLVDSGELIHFVENSGLALHRIAPDGTILWANTVELQQLGYSHDQYIGHNIAEFHVDAAAVQDILRCLERRGVLHEYEARLRAKDGSIRYVSISSNPHNESKPAVHTWCFTRDVTEQKRVAELQERLAAIVESSDDAIISKDLNGIIRSWNRGAERIFGYTADEVVGQPITMLVVPNRADEIPNILNRIRRGERVDHYQTERRTKDGRVLAISLTVSPIRDATGTIIGASKIARDITAAKRAEEAQRQLERQLMLLIEASGALLASPQSAHVVQRILDTATQFIVADAYAVWRRQRTGGTWTLIMSRGLSAEYERTASEQAVASLQTLLLEPIVIDDVENSPLVQHRAAYYRTEGIRSVLAVPLNIHGEVGGTLVFYQRVPHRFTGEEVRLGAALGNLAAAALGTAELYDLQLELRAEAECARRRASFLAEAGGTLSSSLDYTGTLGLVAQAAVPVFADWCAVDVEAGGQLERVALAHQDPAKVEFAREFRRKYPPAETDPTLTAMRTRQSILVEQLADDVIVKGARSAEHLQDVRSLGIQSFIVVPMLARGRALGTLTFVTAESGRRYTNADLALAEELARRAATAIDNAQLFTDVQVARESTEQSNEELRRVNGDLEQFAYSASHDLKEPLRMMAIYSQMLQRKYHGKLDSAGEQYLSYVAGGAQRMEELVRDLLAYTQAVTASGPDPSTLVEADAVLAQTLVTLKHAIEDSGATIERGPLPRLLVTEVHLTQLFQNLVGNALKYRGTEPPRILIDAAREGELWKICIRDNGIGIARQYAEQVFGIFKRLHTTERYSGTGIGLAICQRIVHRYDGSIWVESEGEGKGSTFCFTLPGEENA